MKKITKEQVIVMHSELINKTGGTDGIRDEGLLDSAIKGPFQFFGSKELYPSIQEKAARLCFNIIKNHPFVDGNKRTGILTMLVFLDINGLNIECNDMDIVNLGLGVASGEESYKNIYDWIRKNSCSD
jgi:death-on-curing protein